MRTSTSPRASISASAPSYPSRGLIKPRISGDIPAFSMQERIISIRQRLVFAASLPPRSTVALPVFRQRAAASTVTFGRASYIIATTPIGTREQKILSPLGRTKSSPVPTGSSIVTRARSESQIPDIRALLSIRRSSMWSGTPFSRADARSVRFAFIILSALASSASAIERRRAFFSSVDAAENARDASFADLHISKTFVLASIFISGKG